MAKIKIIGDSVATNGPKKMPLSTPMSGKTERFRPGGKYDLTLDKSFKREGGAKK